MRASEVNFKTAKILKMCKYQSLSFYVPLGAVLQISGGISHQRRRKEGQTRSGSHGMEGVEDGLKYRGLRRWFA